MGTSARLDEVLVHYLWSGGNIPEIGSRYLPTTYNMNDVGVFLLAIKKGRNSFANAT
jgi:hypothetical protein